MPIQNARVYWSPNVQYNLNEGVIAIVEPVNATTEFGEDYSKG